MRSYFASNFNNTSQLLQKQECVRTPKTLRELFSTLNFFTAGYPPKASSFSIQFTCMQCMSRRQMRAGKPMIIIYGNVIYFATPDNKSFTILPADILATVSVVV